MGLGHGDADQHLAIQDLFHDLDLVQHLSMRNLDLAKELPVGDRLDQGRRAPELTGVTQGNLPETCT